MSIHTLRTEKANQKYIEALYYEYRTLIIRIAHKYVYDTAIAEDILQETFLQITRKAEFLQTLSPDKIETYLILMVRGQCVDYLRKSHRKDLVDITDETLLNMLDQSPQTANQSSAGFRKAELFMMLNDLPPEDLFLLVGRYYLQLSIEELAIHIGGTATRIRTKLYRAKKRAFETWKKSGLSMEDFFNG